LFAFVDQDVAKSYTAGEKEILSSGGRESGAHFGGMID